MAACARQTGPNYGNLSNQNGLSIDDSQYATSPGTTAPGGSSPTSPTSPRSTSAAGPVVTQGTINGGGGVGIRCGEHLEVLDLYEARRAGFKLVESPKDQDATVRLIAGLFAHHFWNVESVSRVEMTKILGDTIVRPILEGRAIKNFETESDEQVEFVDHLELSNDFGRYTVPAGCRLEQIAFFSDTMTKLSIVRAAWDKLDWLSKAVLVAHELIYLMDRRDGLDRLKPDTQPFTSESTRLFVGRLLSTPTLPAASDDVPAQRDLVRCANLNYSKKDLTAFYAFETNGVLHLAFNTILGAESLYPLRAEFKNMHLNGEEWLSEEADVTALGSTRPSEFKARITRRRDGQLIFELIYQGLPVRAKQIVSCESF